MHKHRLPKPGVLVLGIGGLERDIGDERLGRSDHLPQHRNIMPLQALNRPMLEQVGRIAEHTFDTVFILLRVQGQIDLGRARRPGDPLEGQAR
ncbi:hypothetical protein CUPL110328_25390 [Cupriavidus plantarum]